ncbi:MAG TPA: class I SAM-dependent methyltransferase [Ktedonobacteraceae bacterium]|nr:class I SAM-dependent methyltransferase [Ktedonobacteraceae bacterium]
MNPQMHALLHELYQQGQANDSTHSIYNQRMMNLEPATAQLISLFVRSSKRQHILEIGTSNGYSTTWLAWSAQQTGGRVTSIDREPHKHELAAANLSRAGLRELVELCCGSATEIVATLPGPFDCVFFDADRFSAPSQVTLLLPKLTSDVLLLADNAISHPDEIAGYLAAIQALPDFESMIIPVGKGLSVAYRARG